MPYPGWITQDQLTAELDDIYATHARADGGGFNTLKANLAAGLDTHLAVLGDSTGDEITEWVYLLGQHIAGKQPGYNVEYRVWDDTTQKHDPAARIGTASGGRASMSILAAGTTFMPCIYPGARTNTTDLEASVRMQPGGAWTGPGANGTLVAQLGSSGSRVFDFWLSSSGIPAVAVYPDGATAQQFTGTAPVSLAAATEGWVRVTVQGNDGAGNSVATFYQSTDGATWTQIGAAVTKTGTTTALPTARDTQQIEAGGRNAGNAFTGATLYEVHVRDGIGGPLIATPNAAEWIISDATMARRNGGPTLTIWNGSKAGAGIAYLGDTTRLPKLLPLVGITTVILSDAHNEAYVNGPAWRKLYKGWVDQVRSRIPAASLITISQNPQNTPALNPQHERRCLEIFSFGPAIGAHVIDVHTVFLNDPRGLGVLIAADGVHPSNPDGRNLWAQVVNNDYDAS